MNVGLPTFSWRIKAMPLKRMVIGANILLLAVPLLAQGWQEETSPMPSQRLDPKIQKIVSEISADRIAQIEKRLESFETSNTMSDTNQPDRGVGAARQWIFYQFKSYSP